jgi:hypothetical protein
MRVIVTMQHPAHVHFFRNAIAEWKAAGHAVKVCVREQSVATALLQRYDIDHTVLAGATHSFLSLAVTQLKYETRLLGVARRFEPDVMVAIAEPGVAHVARLVGARSVVFTDTEHGTLQNILAFPLATRICVPECYKDRVPTKAVRYPGYHELAYLHPDRFEPSESVLREQGIEPDDTLVVLRMRAWKSAHDVGKRGLTSIEAVVRRLEATGATVIISAETDAIPDELLDRQYDIAPEHMHHLLAHANLFVGESATMASESAVLGTPAVYISNWELGYTGELEHEYGLLYNFVEEDREKRQERGLAKACEILTDGVEGPPEAPGVTWADRRRRMLTERVDTTTVILEQVEQVAGDGVGGHERSVGSGEVSS